MPPVRVAIVGITIKEVITKISMYATREGGNLFLPIAFDVFYISMYATREGGNSVILLMRQSNIISMYATREGGN